VSRSSVFEWACRRSRYFSYLRAYASKLVKPQALCLSLDTRPAAVLPGAETGSGSAQCSQGLIEAANLARLKGARFATLRFDHAAPTPFDPVRSQRPFGTHISRCINVVDFFSDMASLVDGGALQLSHFALKAFGYEEEQWSEEVMEAAHLALRNLVKAPKLQGLHLSWGQEPPLGSILPELPLGAPNLRCLGVYDGRDIMHHESLHSSDNLHDVLKRCPQLQALGWTIDGAGLLDSQYTQHLMDDTFMVRLEVTTLLSLAYAL
jgi:hypothetical protein